MFWVVNRCSDRDNATLPEFEEVLKAMNMLSLIPFAARIFDLFDNNRDGTVDMREILCGFSSLKNSKGEDALRLCFQVNFMKVMYIDYICINLFEFIYLFMQIL
jgi:hypothetical protein